MSQTEIWSDVSAIFLTATAFIAFYRERKKYKKLLRRLMLLSIIGAGIASCVISRASEGAVREAEKKSGEQITQLKQAVQSEKDDNNRSYGRYMEQFN